MNWMYRGIWGVLTRWFRVPEQPPTLPALSGESLQTFRPSPDYLRYQMLFFWITTILFGSAWTIAWTIFLIGAPIVALWLLPLLIGVAVISPMVGYLAIHLNFDTTWYVLSQRSLRIRSGIWVIKEATITFENIQNVTVESGPIERVFKIGNVVVDTAGGGGSAHQGKGGEASQNLHQGKLAGVSNATEIRQLILNRLSGSRSSGLGDDHSPAHAWTAAHIAVLTEIRDALK